jgi:hypothetical protein
MVVTCFEEKEIASRSGASNDAPEKGEKRWKNARSFELELWSGDADKASTEKSTQ